MRYIIIAILIVVGMYWFMSECNFKEPKELIHPDGPGIFLNKADRDAYIKAIEFTWDTIRKGDPQWNASMAGGCLCVLWYIIKSAIK